jgi:hypothetical protein
METKCHAAILDQEFVAAATGVDRRFAVMENDGARRRCWRLEPELKTKGVAASEIAVLWKREAVLPVQFHSLA